jgi:pimeloyl-ACP methyl ester carboxylesterase
MKKFILLSLLISITYRTIPLLAQDIVDKHTVEGSWLGKLEVSAVSLRIVFNLTLAGPDSLAVTLDSPDQGAKGIEIGPITLDSSKIKILAPMLLAEYNGIVTNDTLIEGTFKQSGMSFPLTLTKLKGEFIMNRPQEPKPPFPYKSEEVKFTNQVASIDLTGTLTIPDGEGPFPGVIMISGSGPQNRNEELMGHKPFLVIADYLSRHGIAVLRYDDRGVGQSQGTPLNATSADFAGDAEAALLFLKTRNDIDPGTIGLAGHSEGGLITSIVAAANPSVAFVISLAGTGVPGDQILYRQIEDISLLSGQDKKEIKAGIAINKKMLDVLKKESDNEKAQNLIQEVYKKKLSKQKSSPEEIDKALKQLNVNLSPVSYNWYRFFIMTDPADYWKKVKCPVLAMNGEKDLQVNAGVNLNEIEKAVMSGGNRNVTAISLPGLNHLFQHCKTGLPSEYGEIEETFSPEALKIISDWILNLKNDRQVF